MWSRWHAPAVLVCLVALAGCGQPEVYHAGAQIEAPAQAREDASAGAGDGRSQAAAWAGEYCAVTAQLAESVSESVEVDPSSPDRASETSMTMLSGVADGLEDTVRRLDELKPAPIDGADRVVEAAQESLTGIGERATQAHERLSETGQGATTEEHRQALDATDAVLDELGQVNVLVEMRDVAGFVEASASVPECAELARTPERHSN